MTNYFLIHQVAFFSLPLTQLQYMKEYQQMGLNVEKGHSVYEAAA